MNSTRRIALLLAAVFLLPALFFSVYEISSLNNDEKIIQDIYNQQLESILFSVNQYSDDVVSSWISRVEWGANEPTTDSIPSRVKSLLELNASIRLVLISDTTADKPNASLYSYDEHLAKRMRPGMPQFLKRNAGEIKQLLSYKRSGFQKLDLRTLPSDTALLHFITFIISQGEQDRVAAMLINQEDFITDMIGPRLQSIAKDKFIISVYYKDNLAPVYSTMRTDSVARQAEAIVKKFWLFPDYALGIRLQGTTLQQVVRERTTTNLLILLFLDLILILAVVMVFRNIRREVQLAQSKADFVSNVSHEIRTPLALISMFAETLQMGRVPSEEKKREYYDIINKETHRLSGIVNKILNFSQMEANKKILHMAPLYVDPEIKEILRTYDFHLHNKGFEYSYQGVEDLCVYADKEAFVEVMVNLIDNAVKYSHEVKKIEIVAASKDGFGLVTVKDYGMGISKSDQKHIFDKFFRVSSGNLAKSRGTGLGLTLVKQLMEKQKGKVTVVSDLGTGSSFSAYFPLATDV